MNSIEIKDISNINGEDDTAPRRSIQLQSKAKCIVNLYFSNIVNYQHVLFKCRTIYCNLFIVKSVNHCRQIYCNFMIKIPNIVIILPNIVT